MRFIKFFFTILIIGLLTPISLNVLAHTVSPISGSGWVYYGTHNPSSTASFTYDSTAYDNWDNINYRTHNANGISKWNQAYSKVNGIPDSESGNKIGVYSNWFSTYCAYHEVTNKSGEHQMTWKIMFNHSKLKGLSSSFRDTIAAHEWGHVFGLKDHNYAGQLMYGSICGGGGTASGPEEGDINGVKVIYP